MFSDVSISIYLFFKRVWLQYDIVTFGFADTEGQGPLVKAQVKEGGELQRALPAQGLRRGGSTWISTKLVSPRTCRSVCNGRM